MHRDKIESLKKLLEEKIDILEAMNLEMEKAIVSCGLQPENFDLDPISAHEFMSGNMIDFIKPMLSPDEELDEEELETFQLGYVSLEKGAECFVTATAVARMGGFSVSVTVNKWEGNKFYYHNGESWVEDTSLIERIELFDSMRNGQK